MKKYLAVTQADGSEWGVPVEMIALNRATHYASEFDGDVERSLNEDTLPLFESDSFEVKDWASNNMNWDEFGGHQIKLKDADSGNFQEAWMNGEKRIVTLV